MGKFMKGNAMTENGESLFKDYKETTVKSETIYEGKILTLKLDTVELPNMKYAKREIALHPRGVGIIAMTERGTMYMVRQYRVAIDETIVEIPAGLVDPGETPQEAAERELQEEIKFKPGKLTYLLDAYSSPGCSNEKLSIFVAEGLVHSEMDLDETEFLDVLEIPVEDLYKDILNFKINDAKTVIGILYAYHELFLPNKEEMLKNRKEFENKKEA